MDNRVGGPVPGGPLPGGPLPGGVEDPAGAAGLDAVDSGELPVRRRSGRMCECKIRRMDDPEILERVLSGLLNLQ